MALRTQTKQFVDLAHELEDICVNDVFLSLAEETNNEQDADNKYTHSDVLSYVSDVEYAIILNYTNMDSLGKEAVCSQSSKQIDQEVIEAPVPWMFYPGIVLEFIVYTLYVITRNLEIST